MIRSAVSHLVLLHGVAIKGRVLQRIEYFLPDECYVAGVCIRWWRRVHWRGNYEKKKRDLVVG